MICIPIMAESNAEALAMLKHAAAEPADLYELRLDRIAGAPDAEGLVAAADRPVVATCRSTRQGGYFGGTAEERLALLQRAMDAGAAYVDAEEDVVSRLRRRDGAVVIASWHDFAGVPDDIGRIVAGLADLPCDWIKFAAAANRPADAVRILDAVAGSRKPAIGVAMGEIGLPARILGPARGSKITFGALAPELGSAPGQPTARELAEVYRTRSLGRNTAVYGLAGDPVRHSLGYRLHNRAFAAAGLDAVYIPGQCPDAADFFATMPDGLDIRGLSVTMPHKRAALEWAARASGDAVAIGAANTLTRMPDGWFADNTDCSAAAAAVGAAAAANRLDIRDKPALVLGSGGAARAIATGLASLGCRVFLTGRDARKTGQAAESAGWASTPWAERGKRGWAVVANATPLGMRPNDGESPFPAGGWRRGMIAFDSVYRPRETRFLREAGAAGAATVDGLEMFIRQAAAQFKLWTGLELPPECRACLEVDV